MTPIIPLIELFIGTRESKDSRVQAGLASPSPALKGLFDSPNQCNIGTEQARLTHIGLGHIDSQTVKCLIILFRSSVTIALVFAFTPMLHLQHTTSR